MLLYFWEEYLMGWVFQTTGVEIGGLRVKSDAGKTGDDIGLHEVLYCIHKKNETNPGTSTHWHFFIEESNQGALACAPTRQATRATLYSRVILHSWRQTVQQTVFKVEFTIFLNLIYSLRPLI